MSKRLYLMRHGETLFNKLGRIQGACDSPLTDDGIRQAKMAKQYYKDNNIIFSRCIASTQERASDTLELIIENEDYDRVKGIKEWNFGLYEGAMEYLNPPHKPTEESYGDFFLDYGGESVDQVEKRMTETLRNIMEDLEGDNALIVSHGGAMYSFYLKWRNEQLERPKFNNCCILVYDFDKNNSSFELIKSIDVMNKYKEE